MQILVLGKLDTIIVYIFKILINSVVSLVLADFSETSTTFQIDTNFCFPAIFSKCLIKLLGRYISTFEEQENLEQFFFTSTSNDNQSLPLGMSYLLNFLLPILFWSLNSSSKMNPQDIAFAIEIIISSLKSSCKTISNFIFVTPRQQIIDGFDTNFMRLHNVQNKSIKHIKDLMNQTALLGIFFKYY